MNNILIVIFIFSSIPYAYADLTESRNDQSISQVQETGIFQLVQSDESVSDEGDYTSEDYSDSSENFQEEEDSDFTDIEDNIIVDSELDDSSVTEDFDEESLDEDEFTDEDAVGTEDFTDETFGRKIPPYQTPEDKTSGQISPGLELPTVLVKPNCKDCQLLENYLRVNHIFYNRYNVLAQELGKEKYDEVGGGELPITIYNSRIIRGYDIKEIYTAIIKNNPNNKK